jgi:hypothetical protein
MHPYLTKMIVGRSAHMCLCLPPSDWTLYRICYKHNGTDCRGYESTHRRNVVEDSVVIISSIDYRNMGTIVQRRRSAITTQAATQLPNGCPS